MEFGEKKYSAVHKREKMINIPAVDVRVNKIFINFTPDEK